MMRKQFFFLVSATVLSHQVACGAGGPMNSDWFYGKNEASEANECHQKRQWADAEIGYNKVEELSADSLNDPRNTLYLVKLNRSACRMAQAKASRGWSAFSKLQDESYGCDQEYIDSWKNSNCVWRWVCAKTKQVAGRQKTFTVETNEVGIGDIVHFWQAAVQLKQTTGDRVVVSVKPFLIPMLEKRAAADGIELMSAKKEIPAFSTRTHIISLIGDLEMTPHDLAQVSPLLPEEQALARVRGQVDPLLAAGKTVMALFLGEKRPATLIGGKRLPHDVKAHGRELDSAPFNALVRKYSSLHIIDCGTKASKINADDDIADRVSDSLDEEKPFDTIVALAAYMNERSKIIAMAADQGPSNVFARSLNEKGQRRMAFIIPNGQEYDMRMEGEGDHYTHMLTKGCHVYKCATPADQETVVERAYQDLSQQD